jgi:hypothetical protein
MQSRVGPLQIFWQNSLMLETEDLVKERMWVIYVDGSSTKKNGGDGVVLITSDAEELCSSLNLEFKTTNNEA